MNRHATIDVKFRMPSVSLSIIDSLRSIPPASWDRLVGQRPLLSHAFLHALHETGCATPERGWTPRYLTASAAGALVGAVPLYLCMEPAGVWERVMGDVPTDRSLGLRLAAGATW